MQKYLFLFSISTLLCAGHLNAQYAAPNESQPEPLSEWVLKLSPLGFFHPDGGPEISIEYLRPKKRMGFQLEIQPIFVNIWRMGENDGFAPANTIKSSYPLGIRLRPEFRYYLYARPKEKPWVYLSIDGEFKYVNTQRLGTFPVFNGGSDPAYSMEVTYNDMKEVYGFNLKSGMMIPFGDSRFLLDISYGMGAKYRDFSFKNIPPGVSEPERPVNDLGNTQEDGWIFSMPIAVRFGFRL